MPRAEVHWFAERMEAELAENDHKRHWSSCTPGWLLKRLEDEVAELRRAVETGAPAARVFSVAADVGNFAMMIADHAAHDAEASANAWNGAEVIHEARNPSGCHGEVEYLRDDDHDGGSCEVFRCLKCGASIHIEMPD